jgi:aspartyl-tRNA(Asn)/glutamyl-tRNA(Gln) amidotransferase subunit A
MTTPTTITELQKNLKEKNYSLTELLDTIFERVERHSDLNAFITVTKDYAYDRAKRLQKIIEDNPDAFAQFSLLGVPMSVKDVYLTKKIRTTAASNVLKDYVPEYSSTSFVRLEKAGAILIGKANCDAWAHGSSGENSDFGESRNPWNKEYVPGGSSSGSGVSVAADFSLISPCTDTCGSIRLPANYCGLTGLKPTYGAVSRYGVVAMASSLDTMGHITRSAEDSEKVYEVTSGPDGFDSTLTGFKYENKTLQKKLRIGIPKEFTDAGLSSEIEKTLGEFVSWLSSQGHEIIDVSLPSTKHAISVYYIVQPAEVSSNLSRYDGVRYGNDRDSFGMEAKRRIMLGTFVLSSGYYDAYYKKAMQVRTILIREVDEVFDKVDLILAPVAPTPPFKLGEKSADPMKMYLTDIYAATANLTGIPSLAFPTGFSNGLPLGLQLMAPKNREDLFFEVVKKYQDETDHHTKRAL